MKSFRCHENFTSFFKTIFTNEKKKKKINFFSSIAFSSSIIIKKMNNNYDFFYQMKSSIYFNKGFMNFFKEVLNVGDKNGSIESINFDFLSLTLG